METIKSKDKGKTFEETTTPQLKNFKILSEMMFYLKKTRQNYIRRSLMKNQKQFLSENKNVVMKNFEL